MPSRHWLYFGGFVLAGILLVGAALMGVIDALSVLSDRAAYSGDVIVLAMLGEAAEWVAIGIVLGLIALVFLTATLVSILRSTSLHRSDRLVSVVERLEHEYPLLKQFDASEKFEPTTEDRQQQLKDQYVAGEITDEEFEREMERLIDDNSSDPGTQSGTSMSPERDK